MPSLGHVLEVAGLIAMAYLFGCATGYVARLAAYRLANRPRFVPAAPVPAPVPAPVRQPTPAQRLARTVRAEPEPPAKLDLAPPSALHLSRPPGLESPQGVADDLRQIKGVGPKTVQQLNALGIHHFWQIAAWTPANIEWLEAERVAIKGRIAREQWVEQAALFATAPTSSAA